MNVKDTIKTLLNVPTDTAIMLKGNHGIGKSAVVKQVAQELGVPCIDFRLSQNDVGDIKGIPFHRNGRTIFAPPEFMPITEADANELKELLGLSEDISLGRFGDKGILFLDEINRASREVQQAAFELVLDRRLNLRSLPDGWRVVTAINDNDDLYSVGQLDPAFVSRFMVIDFNPSVEEWLDWARDKGVHDSITTFITKHPELLDPNSDTIDENNKEGVRKLFDRRSWHKFSDTILKFEENGVKLLGKAPEDMSYLIQVAAGFLGSTCAVRFAKFIESDYDSLNADMIINKWDKSVGQKLEAIVKSGRIPELAAYNDLIVEHLKDKKSLNKKQSANLTKYIAAMPKEIVSSFWQSFNMANRELSESWYSSDPAVGTIILKALVNPDAL